MSGYCEADLEQMIVDMRRHARTPEEERLVLKRLSAELVKAAMHVLLASGLNPGEVADMFRKLIAELIEGGPLVKDGQWVDDPDLTNDEPEIELGVMQLMVVQLDGEE